jgi:hypothetical protein
MVSLEHRRPGGIGRRTPALPETPAIAKPD